MKITKLILFSIIFIVMLNVVIAPEIDLLGLTLDVKESGIDVDNVNITVEIYDAATEGSLICNMSNNFVDKMREIKEVKNE